MTNRSKVRSHGVSLVGRWVWLIGVLLSFGSAHGQVNTERMRAIGVEGARATVGSDVALQSGTVDLFEIGLTGRLDVGRGPHYSLVAAEVRYGTKDDTPFRDRTFGPLRYNY